MYQPKYWVLVVDDEESIRTFVEKVLQEAGYKTLVAKNAKQAMDLFATGNGCDLLLTDLVMPEVTGDELARRLRAIRPDLKVLYLTGYSDTLFSKKPTLWEDEAFLEKPTSIRGIEEAVALLLFNQVEPLARMRRKMDRRDRIAAIEYPQ